MSSQKYCNLVMKQVAMWYCMYAESNYPRSELTFSYTQCLQNWCKGVTWTYRFMRLIYYQIYLTSQDVNDNCQLTLVGSSVSDPLAFPSGVLQGSVLGYRTTLLCFLWMTYPELSLVLPHFCSLTILQSMPLGMMWPPLLSPSPLLSTSPVNCCVPELEG